MRRPLSPSRGLGTPAQSPPAPVACMQRLSASPAARYLFFGLRGEQHTTFCDKPPNLNCIRRRPQRPDEQVWSRRNTRQQLARLGRRGLVRLAAAVLSHQCARCLALRFRDLPAAVGWRHAASRIAGRTKKSDGNPQPL